MKSSIRISKGGNQIRFTGAAANEVFKALCDHSTAQLKAREAVHTHVNNGVDDNCRDCGLDLRHEIHRRICKACGCPVDGDNICGCNPHDA